MVYLHSEALTPDPTYGRDTEPLAGDFCGLRIYPASLCHAAPPDDETARWADRFDMFTDPGPVGLPADACGRGSITLDLGTEVDASVHVTLEPPRACAVNVYLGESEPEASGLVFGERPNPLVTFRAPAGRQCVATDRRGVRFVRIVLRDLQPGERVNLHVAAECVFAMRDRIGDLRCSDARFQRVWQTSVYTARLCTRPDDLWDGIKRDRHGWYGDARVTKLATDAVYFAPASAEAMLERLPTDDWVNGIPNYSFDAVAMLEQHVLTYGLDRACTRPVYERICAMLDWARRTQTDGDGFIRRDDALKYFFKIGFVDWSRMPVGGRLEELGWLQCKYVEALRTAGRLARLLDDSERAQQFESQAEAVGRRVVEAFWRDGRGFVHTLNHVGEVGNPHLPGYDGHYQRTYVDEVRLGASGPSRQANALAVMAGLADQAMRSTILRQVFDNDAVDPVITAYFGYFEQTARALCGDRAGAVCWFRDYVGHMLEAEDAACVWELYDPKITDSRKYASHFDMTWRFPLSLCHGWGAGAVPLATEHLLGVRPAAPGFAKVRLAPAPGLPWTFEATLPTPLGPIAARRETEGGPVCYRLPEAVAVDGQPGEGVLVESHAH